MHTNNALLELLFKLRVVNGTNTPPTEMCTIIQKILLQGLQKVIKIIWGAGNGARWNFYTSKITMQ